LSAGGALIVFCNDAVFSACAVSFLIRRVVALAVRFVDRAFLKNGRTASRATWRSAVLNARFHFRGEQLLMLRQDQCLELSEINQVAQDREVNGVPQPRGFYSRCFFTRK
jgi:hypothetical protein